MVTSKLMKIGSEVGRMQTVTCTVEYLLMKLTIVKRLQWITLMILTLIVMNENVIQQRKLSAMK